MQIVDPLISITLPRSILRECLLSALEDDIGQLPIFTEFMLRIRAAEKQEKNKGAKK
jgi:hypothetical protein